MVFSWTNFFIMLAISVLSTVMAPKPKPRDDKNEVHRQGVDHPLERLYGTRRLGVVVTAIQTNRRLLNPASLSDIDHVIRSSITREGKDDTQSSSRKSTLLVEGPLCVTGRLNSPFQGDSIADVHPMVNEKEYDDVSLKTSSDISVGNAFELHLKGGVRHPWSQAYGLGTSTNTFSYAISATACYQLSLRRELAYSGIPESTFDLTSNFLFDPTVSSNNWNSPLSWTGRCDNPFLQLLDYLLDADFGVGLKMDEIDAASFSQAMTVADAPTGSIIETTTKQAIGGQWGRATLEFTVKSYDPRPLMESNLLLSTEDPLNGNIEQLLAACRGAVLFKSRAGKWSVAPNWIHHDDLQQPITGTGRGPFVMDWPTDHIIVRKNGTVMSSGGYSIVKSATLSTSTNGVETGDDPDTVGISFTSPLVTTDKVVIDYRKGTGNSNGILGVKTEFHIIDSPETLGLDYDATADAQGIGFICISDPSDSQLARTTLDERYNQCVVKFSDKTTLYKQNEVVWPAEGSEQLITFLGEDNDKPLVKNTSINSIISADKALDYAEYEVRTSRSADTLSYTLDALGLQLDPLDTVLITDRRQNINGELWRCIKMQPHPDLTVTAVFVRYEREDFTYAVERFSQVQNIPLFDRFDAVQNLAWTEDNDSGVVGSGELSWTASLAADAYLCSFSKKTVWEDKDYTSGAIVFHVDGHWKSKIAITAPASDPDSSSNWEKVIEDDDYWYQFADTTSTTAITPDITWGRTYAYRVLVRSTKKGIGPATFVTADVLPDDFNVNFFKQDDAPTTGMSDGDYWLDTNDGDNQHKYDGTQWVDVRDHPLVAALASLSGSSDGRGQMFVQRAAPVDGDSDRGVLEKDDLWVDLDDGYHPYNYNGSAWVSIQDGSIATAQAAADTAIADAASAQSTADGKIVSFWQNSAPSASVSSLGDIWFDTSDNNKPYRYSGSAWVDAQDDDIAVALAKAVNAKAVADGKAVVFYQTSAPASSSSSTGDLWVDTNDRNKMYRYSGSRWVSIQDGDIAAAQSTASTALTTANSKINTYRQDAAPSRASSNTGDFWIDSNDGNKLYRYSGSSWVAIQDGDIADALVRATDAANGVDGKITLFYQNDAPERADADRNDLWIDSNGGRHLYRFSGYSWMKLTGDLADLDAITLAMLPTITGSKIAANAISRSHVSSGELVQAHAYEASTKQKTNPTNGYIMTLAEYGFTAKGSGGIMVTAFVHAFVEDYQSSVFLEAPQYTATIIIRNNTTKKEAAASVPFTEALIRSGPGASTGEQSDYASYKSFGATSSHVGVPAISEGNSVTVKLKIKYSRGQNLRKCKKAIFTTPALHIIEYNNT